MSGLPYVAALLLAAVFAAAAMAKWRDLPGTARSFRALGVPRPSTTARAMPGVEAALAGGLVLVPAGAAMVAVALLVAFTVFLVGRLRAGVTAPCACFGGLGGGRLSWLDVLRNVLLTGVGVVALFAGWPQLPGPGAIAVGVAAALVAWQGWRRLVTHLGSGVAPSR